MKRILAWAMVAAGTMAGGCGPDAAGGPEALPVGKGKVAVIYFSWSADGNTRFAAETIAAKAGADLFEIKPEVPYPSDFGACCDEAKPECRERLPRPVMPVDGLDFASYDVVFFGTPNWWGTMAPPMRTFISQNLGALGGKALCMFQTHGGGGMQNVGKDFEELVCNATRVQVLQPKAFRGKSVRSDVQELEAFVTDRITVKKE